MTVTEKNGQGSNGSKTPLVRFFVTLSGGEGVSKRVTIFGCFRLLILASKNENNSININDSIIL